MEHKLHYYVIGPFQFLAFSLTVSQILLGSWMLRTDIVIGSTERIVAGALSIAVLIAVLVIFCIVYSIKKNHGDFDTWRENTLHNPN